MHYLGGITLAVFSAALLMHHRPRAFVGLLVVLFIGWEIFEYVFGIQRESNYPLDTVIDLVMDTLGALTVYVIGRLTVWRSH